MYLIIFDPLLINNPDRYYNLFTGDYYTRLIQSTPDIALLSSKEIEEILIYSGAKADADKPAKTANCASLEHTESALKIEYANIQDSAASCADIRKRLYHYHAKNDMLTDGSSPFITIIDDIQQYADIKIGRITPRYKSIMSQIEDYQKKNDWLSIVNFFPAPNNIQKSEYWDDVACLSALCFALSKLAIKAHTDKKTVREINTYNYGKFFLRVNERCMQLDPNNAQHLSNRAYYYYIRYISENKNDLYQEAYKLYEELIPKTAEWYKEKYRFSKLRQKHLKRNKTTNYYSREDWSNICRVTLEDYRELISSYENLDELRKKRYHKIYLKALFGYSILNIDSFYNYWDDYTLLHVFERRLSEQRMNHVRLNEIVTIEGYLNRIYAELNFDDISHLDLNDDPNYFELQYRLAQVEQNKGIVYIMKKQAIKESLVFFEKSNKHLDDLFACAERYKEKRVKFNFPYYAKVTQALNFYFLDKIDECHKCFSKAPTYMLYEQGIIYVLCKDYSNAITVLSKIPETNACYNKAQKLVQRIQMLREKNEN